MRNIQLQHITRRIIMAVIVHVCVLNKNLYVSTDSKSRSVHAMVKEGKQKYITNHS
jgi:hypothetical protein